jgi:hypothetical protein
VSDSVIEQAIREAQAVLWDKFPPHDNLPDDVAVGAIRAIASTPRVQIALERASDTIFAFVLRGVHHISSDELSEPSDILLQLWDVLDDPELNRLLGNSQNPQVRIGLGPKKPPSD